MSSWSFAVVKWFETIESHINISACNPTFLLSGFHIFHCQTSACSISIGLVICFYIHVIIYCSDFLSYDWALNTFNELTHIWSSIKMQICFWTQWVSDSHISTTSTYDNKQCPIMIVASPDYQRLITSNHQQLPISLQITSKVHSDETHR